VLDETRLPPHFLELELTESILLRDPQGAVSVLQSLREIGVKIALDDFGTGYSSLSYLRRLPIDAIKIDQSFVHEISEAPDGSSIVRAIISMGRSLERVVIAEGVETSSQLAFLRAEHCLEGQGFLFSRPLEADDFVRLLCQI
jgi:EAL domain-containing protein (putative c-di-GMP-specific phosphodiesterase class I)